MPLLLFSMSFLSPIASHLERPMKIEIVVDPKTGQSLASRVAPATVASAARSAGRPRRGRARPKKTERPAKSAADLDAEMEDYTAGNAPAAAPTAAA